MARKSYVPVRVAARPPIDKAQCSIKPECAGCQYPRHGFICWSTDGTCLKTTFSKDDGGKRHEH